MSAVAETVNKIVRLEASRVLMIDCCAFPLARVLTKTATVNGFRTQQNRRILKVRLFICLYLEGLSPNTTYRVSIRAKNLRAPQFDEKETHSQEKLSAGIEFRTLPKGKAILLSF